MKIIGSATQHKEVIKKESHIFLTRRVEVVLKKRVLFEEACKYWMLKIKDKAQ